MKSIFLPLFVLLLYKFCSSNSTSIGPCENIENENLSGNITNNTQLIDCFDRLNLTELANIGHEHPELNTIASDVFRHKYSDHVFEIQSVRDDYDGGTTYFIITSINIIIIYDLGLFSNIMRNFGNHIRKLNILNEPKYNYTSGNFWTEINRIANEYGSKSVTQLRLRAINKELWPLYSKPFECVESLRTEIHTDTDGLKLNQLFPNLQKLRIRIVNGVNADFIDSELPHLEQLEITIHMTSFWNGTEQIFSMIKKNPQIRTVMAAHTLPEFNMVINEYLTNLENFTFTPTYPNERLHFETVKHSGLYMLTDCSLANISFSHLESLQLFLYPGQFEYYTEFFRRHQNVSRLHLSSDESIPLEGLTTDLPNLVEVIVSRDRLDLNIENITRFIESHPKLMKFQFNSLNIGESDLKTLREKFEPDWNIVNSGDQKDKFLFERKK